MKRLTHTISLILAILMLSTNLASAANLLTLTCNVLDPGTGTPKTTFAPGNEILLNLNLIGPNNGSLLLPGKDRGVRVQVSAKAKIAGIKLPFNINQSYYLALSDISGTQTESFSVSDSRTITLPTQTPRGSTLTILISAIVGDVGSGSCKKTITVQ
jgi:hypothetical protein